MPNKTTDSVKLIAPYRRFDNNVPRVHTCKNVVNHYEFQINDETDQLETVFVETVDIDKEVQSHADEVGIINVIKLATAMGVNPLTNPFGKKTDGSSIMTEDIETFDDIKQMAANSQSKIDEIAKTLGITSEELVKGLESGSVQSLIDLVESKKQTTEEVGGDK